MKQLFFLLCLLLVAELYAQKSDGPIIVGYGQVWAIDDADYQTDTEREYRVIFDIYGNDDDHAQVNVQLNTIARFLNMRQVSQLISCMSLQSYTIRPAQKYSEMSSIKLNMALKIPIAYSLISYSTMAYSSTSVDSRPALEISQKSR